MFLYYLTSLHQLQTSNFKSEMFGVTSDNSHYSIVKELLLILSTLCRNFNIQSDSQLNAQVSTNPESEISDLQWRSSGGGEGIRTPDPRVANAVLCQLSYTPDKL